MSHEVSRESLPKWPEELAELIKELEQHIDYTQGKVEIQSPSPKVTITTTKHLDC